MFGDKLWMALVTAGAVIVCQAVATGCEDKSRLGLGHTNPAAIRAWTEYTSQEHQPLVCANRYAVRGVDCAISHCGKIALDCDDVGAVYVGDDVWSPYFSEEGAGGTDQRQCAASDEWMTGITCRGEFCDDISVRCTTLSPTTTGNCMWSSWYSEADEPFSAPDGQYIKAVECKGKFCGTKRFRYCVMKVM